MRGHAVEGFEQGALVGRQGLVEVQHHLRQVAHEVDGLEDVFAVGRIEFEEEVGIPAESADWIDLGWIKQKGGKTVYAWAFEGDLPDGFQCRSNMFEMEWPPRSGKMQNFPEVDMACFFSLEDARRKLKEAQTPFLDRLKAALTNGR